jgi:hypothetical protein
MAEQSHRHARLDSMKTLLFGAALLIAATACGSSGSNRTPAPDGWQRIDATSFAAWLPPGWVFNTLQGIDSYVGEFTGDGVTLTFDFGCYSDNLNFDGDPAYDVTFETIDGREAKLVAPRDAAAGLTGVFFTDAGPASGPICDRAMFNLVGRDLTTVQRDVAFTIFRRLEFEK